MGKLSAEQQARWDAEFGRRVIPPRRLVQRGLYAIVNSTGEPIHIGDPVLFTFSNEQGCGRFQGCWFNSSIGDGAWLCAVLPEGGDQDEEVYLPLDAASTSVRLAERTWEALSAVMDEALRRGGGRGATVPLINEIMVERGYIPFDNAAALEAALDEGRDPALDGEVLAEISLILRAGFTSSQTTIAEACEALGLTLQEVVQQARINLGLEARH